MFRTYTSVILLVFGLAGVLPAEETNSASPPCRVQVKSLSVHIKPSPLSDIVTILKYGTVVNVLQTTNHWIRITEGWIPSGGTSRGAGKGATNMFETIASTVNPNNEPSALQEWNKLTQILATNNVSVLSCASFTAFIEVPAGDAERARGLIRKAVDEGLIDPKTLGLKIITKDEQHK